MKNVYGINSNKKAPYSMTIKELHIISIRYSLGPHRIRDYTVAIILFYFLCIANLRLFYILELITRDFFASKYVGTLHHQIRRHTLRSPKFHKNPLLLLVQPNEYECPLSS